MMAVGVEDGLKYIFTKSPLMSRIATRAEFMQCDITYDEMRGFPYIFNALYSIYPHGVDGNGACKIGQAR